MEIADILDLDGVAFKPEAYRRAARALEQLPHNLRTLSKEGRLSDIEGVGEAIAKKIDEYLETGKVEYLEKLRTSHPSGLIEIMHLDGVGPKTTRRFTLEFGIENLEGLREALERGKLEGAKGFGPKKIALLKAAVGENTGKARFPLPVAQGIADRILAELAESGVTFDNLTFAGSLRRRKETVGDLDIIVTSAKPEDMIKKFVNLEGVESVKSQGGTKATIVIEGGIQVDLRAVASESYGAAMQYFTGSKDHNVKIRTMAQQRGLSINEYGITKDEKLFPAKSEKEVYAALGLQWIPPELRENSGEIEAAAMGKLPDSPDASDIRAEMNISFVEVPSSKEMRDWGEAAKEMGLHCLGFVLDLEKVEILNALSLMGDLPRTISGVKIQCGAAPTGKLLSERAETLLKFDYLDLKIDRFGMGKADLLECSRWLRGKRKWGLLSGLAGRVMEGGGPTLKEIAGSTLPLEVAVTGQRVEVESAAVRQAVNDGAKLIISGHPRIPSELTRIRLALGIATKGWAEKRNVVNLGDPPY